MKISPPPSLLRAPTDRGRRVLLVSAVERPADFLFYNGFSPALANLKAGIDRFAADVDTRILSWTSDAELSRALEQTPPAVVGISAFSVFMPLALRIAARVRALDSRVPIILGGYHASAFPRGVGQYGDFDYYVRGEGVRVGPQLIQTLLDGTEPLHNIPGLSWRAESGVEMTALETVSADLDANPQIDWDAVDPGDFARNNTAIFGVDDFRLTFTANKFIPYQTSQGCNHACRFCERDTREVRRWHTPERVVSDLEGIRRRFDSRYIFLTDDHIHKDRERFVALLEALRRYGQQKYYMAVRADELDAELVERMAEAGVCVFHCFPESGAERIRRAMGKPIDMDRLLRNVEHASKSGMLTYGSFVLGWPTETRAEAESSVELARSSCFDLVAFMPLLYFGGADVGKHLPELSIEPDSPAYFEMLASPTEACLAKYGSEEYRRFLDQERLLNIAKLEEQTRRDRLRGMDIEVTPLGAEPTPAPAVDIAKPTGLMAKLSESLPAAAADPAYRVHAISYDDQREVVAIDLGHSEGDLRVYVSARSSQPHFAQTRLFNVAYRDDRLSHADEAALRCLMGHLDRWLPTTDPTALPERIPEPHLIMDDPEQVKVYADWDVEEPFRDFVTHFQRVFPGKPITGDVLDLGCGQGEVTFLFARAFPDCRIDGVDAAEPMLEQARRKLQRAGEQRLRFVHALLPEESALRPAYDCVISNSLLHHLPTADVLWQTARKYARPGAPIYVMDLVRPESREKAAALVDSFGDGLHAVVRKDFFNSLLAAYTLDEIREQLSAAGLDWFTVEPISDIQAITYGRMAP